MQHWGRLVWEGVIRTLAACRVDAYLLSSLKQVDTTGLRHRILTQLAAALRNNPWHRGLPLALYPRAQDNAGQAAPAFVKGTSAASMTSSRATCDRRPASHSPHPVL
jgi:hypothetical protein